MRLVWLRRAVQTVSLALFVLWFPRGVNLFFQLDPLAMLTTLAAAHAVAAGMLLSLATLALTILCGRWFCGWVCPLGTVHHVVSTARGRGSPPKAPVANTDHRRYNSKYYVLAFFLGASLLGVSISGWLDPLAFLFRSLATVIYPSLNDVLIRTTGISDPVYDFLRLHLLAARQPHYYGNLLIGILFGATLALNVVRPRFWCRYLCPLGALLGIAARKSLVRLRRDPRACNDCGLCEPHCQGADNPAECLYCFNCRRDCPASAIRLEFRKPAGAKTPDPGRRRVLASGAAGFGAALLFHTHPLGEKRSFHPDLIRPPGALAEDAFLSTCLRCGECMKVCPTNGIHPAAMEAGLEGLWTPVMKMTVGYCEYECVLCTQACPSGAIRPLEIAEKQKIKIGLAYIDRNRCLPYAYGRTCIVCEEHCPTPKKAIRFDEVKGVKQPRVDPELCIGCGICTNKCVIKAGPAIVVASAGETRNPENGVLL